MPRCLHPTALGEKEEEEEEEEGGDAPARAELGDGLGEGVNSYTKKLFAGVSALMEESCRISGRGARSRAGAQRAGRGWGSHAEWQIWATVPAPGGTSRDGDSAAPPVPPPGCMVWGWGGLLFPISLLGLVGAAPHPSAASVLPQHPPLVHRLSFCSITFLQHPSPLHNPSLHSTHTSPAPFCSTHPSASPFCSTHPST